MVLLCSIYVDRDFDEGEPDQDRITRFSYNDLDYLTQQIVNYADGDPASGGVDSDLIVTMTPDALGRTTAMTDPLGRQMVLQYDALGRVVTQIENYQDGVHSDSDPPDVDIITSSGYNALGQTIAMTDAVGLVTRYSYDGMGRLAEEVINAQPGGPTDRETNVTTSYQYNAIGALVEMTDPRGEITEYSVDKLGRTIRRTEADDRYVSFTYDGLGTLRAVREGFDLLPTAIQTDPLGRPTATIQAYDDGVTTPEERDTDLITRTVYDAAGRVTSVVDPNEIRTVYRYDVADRLIGVIENYQDGEFDPAISDADVSTRYGYDRAGNRTDVWDANDSYWQTSYDALDRPINRTDPLTRQATMVYDRGGRLDTLTRANGDLVDFGYDAADRPTRVHYPDPANPASTTAIDYTYRVDGVRQTMVDGRGSTSYGYDALKRLTEVVDPQTGTLGYRYDAAGNRDQVSYPGSPPLDYRYNKAGRLSEITQGDDTLAAYSYSFFGDGRVFAEYLAQADMRLVMDYDQAMRVSEIAEQDGPARFQTTYDRAGRPIAQEETLETEDGSASYSRSLTYDDLGRLTGVQDTPGTSYAYGYDAVGNRTSATEDGVTTTRAYDAAHQVVGWSYDDNGRLIDDGTQTYRYDALDRLLVTSDGSTATAYTYTGDGDLVAATAADTTTRYTQDVGAPLSQVVQTTQDDTTTDYVYGLGSGPVAARTGAATTSYARDQLGSLRMARASNGTATAALRYDPWGAPLADSPTPFGFTGEQHDTTTGLVHLRARWYNPSNGTFLSTDPFVGIASQPYSLHPYQYAFNSPVQFSDPSGEFPLAGFLLRVVGGALIGGGIEYARQVIVNRANGLSWRDALTQICVDTIIIAALSGAGIAGSIARVGVGALLSAGVGGGLDVLAQLALGGWQWQNVNVGQVYLAMLSGALGFGASKAINARFIDTIFVRTFANTIASAGIGAGTNIAQSVSTNSPIRRRDIAIAALTSGITGGVGSFAGDGLQRFMKARLARGLRSQTTAQFRANEPIGKVHPIRKSDFWNRNPNAYSNWVLGMYNRSLREVSPFSTGVANSLGVTIANSGSFVAFFFPPTP